MRESVRGVAKVSGVSLILVLAVLVFAINSDLVRPITGGSGEFEGATGSALTEHFADGTWRHTFRIHRP